MALTWAQLEQHLGVARLAHYVDHCRGDQGQAIELYQWNAHFAAAFWHDLGHVEVALRNALDARMEQRIRQGGHGVDWLDDPRRELGRDAIKAGWHIITGSGLTTGWLDIKTLWLWPDTSTRISLTGSRTPVPCGSS